jgi:hypothetical protein
MITQPREAATNPPNPPRKGDRTSRNNVHESARKGLKRLIRNWAQTEKQESEGVIKGTMGTFEDTRNDGNEHG